MTSKITKADILKSEGSNTPSISATDLAELQKTAGKVEELQKAADKVADLEKAAEATTAKLAELLKANETATAKLEAIELEKAAVAQTNMEDLVKGFTFIGDEDQEAVVASLLKSKDAVLLTTLEKAQTAITAFAEAEHGTSATEDLKKTAAEQANDDFDTLAADVMKSRKKGAK